MHCTAFVQSTAIVTHNWTAMFPAATFRRFIGIGEQLKNRNPSGKCVARYFDFCGVNAGTPMLFWSLNFDSAANVYARRIHWCCSSRCEVWSNSKPNDFFAASMMCSLWLHFRQERIWTGIVVVVATVDHNADDHRWFKSFKYRPVEHRISPLFLLISQFHKLNRVCE